MMKNSVPAAHGKVYFIGTGPGDPGLLTTRCLEVLGQCDVVVFDELVSEGILGCARKGAERVFSGGPAFPSRERVSAYLADRAAEGARVVRLRGGDPYLLGSGGEEALQCRARGVDFEIIPGVSTLAAFCAYSGIPLLQAALARHVTILSGPWPPDADTDSSMTEESSEQKHRAIRIRRRSKEERPSGDFHIRRTPAIDEVEEARLEPTRPDWKAVAAADTLVFLHPERSLDFIRKGLLAGGRPPSEPAALITGRDTGRPSVIATTLDKLTSDTGNLRLQPPVVLVVGDVVNLREHLAIVEQKKLLGLRIGVVATDRVPSEMIRRLREEGGQVDVYTTFVARPVQGVEEELAMLADDFGLATHLVFASARSVDVFVEALASASLDLRILPPRIQLVAVGRATGRRLAEIGLRPSVVESTLPMQGFRTPSSAGNQPPRLFILGEMEVIKAEGERLRREGYAVTAIPLYEQEVSSDRLQALRYTLEARRLDAVFLLSELAAQHFAQALGAGDGDRGLCEGVTLMAAHAGVSRGLPDQTIETPGRFSPFAKRIAEVLGADLMEKFTDESYLTGEDSRW